MAIEIGIHLPQVGFTWDELRARIAECDELGIPSVWLMDHLYPPGLPNVPSFEAWTAVTALSASGIWCSATLFAIRRCWPRWRSRSIMSAGGG